MKVYVVIPFFSNGTDVNTNEVATFIEFAAAENYARENEITYYDIVVSYVDLIL